jgi:hypothetical protein
VMMFIGKSQMSNFKYQMAQTHARLLRFDI